MMDFVDVLKSTSVFPIMGVNYDDQDFVDIDLSIFNDALPDVPNFDDIDLFVNDYKTLQSCLWAIGGYLERRNLYVRSEHFEGEDVRNIHLGVDIWGPSSSRIYAPLSGEVAYGAYNSQHLDYGYTLILRHNIRGCIFHTLYGHLSKKYFNSWIRGKEIKAGEIIAEFGDKKENGGWPPHLHFQIIKDLGNWVADYPGVCASKDVNYYSSNCPDPMHLIQKGRPLTY